MQTCRTPRSGPGDDSARRRYVLSYATFARARYFTAREPVALVSAQFLRAAADERFAVLTYCFIPDRVQLLVEAPECGDDARGDDGCGDDARADVAAFVARSRQYAARHFSARTGRPLWQRDAFVRMLREPREPREPRERREPEDALAISRYILAGPVRAGLVAHPRDYPFSGSFAWDRQARLDVAQRRGCG